MLSNRLRLRLSRTARMEGFNIHVANYLDKPNDLIERVAASLQLIRTIEPRRYQRIVRDLSTIIVSDLGVSSSTRSVTNLCTLEQRLVRTKSAASVARTIVHEATHARLFHAGIVTRRRIQGRVERACIGEEIGFTRRLEAAGWGGADEMIAALERAPTDPRLIAQRGFEARAAVMRASSLPRWVVRAWIAWNQPRESREAHRERRKE